MNLQIQLLELFKTALENSKPFDDGLNMPYSCMTLTKNGYHLSCFETPTGNMTITLSAPKYSQDKGFYLCNENNGKIAGHIYVDSKIKFIKEDNKDLWSSLDLYLEELYEQNPGKVEQAIQEYLQEISVLTKDIERTKSSKRYHTENMAKGFDKCRRPITIEVELVDNMNWSTNIKRTMGK